jgi:DNA-binding response OmpR family regulator
MHNKRVLFIDDEKDFTILISTLLGFHDFEVDAISDPHEAAERIAQVHYDAVVTDLMMPGLDGFGIIRLIRQHPHYTRTPLLVLSARTLSDEERKFLLQNDVHFVMKPFDPQGLVDQIRGLTSEA